MSVMDLFDTTGKVVIVTGASSGLGVSFARGFAEAGADVVLAARRAEKLADTAAAVGKALAEVPADRDRRFGVRAARWCRAGDVGRQFGGPGEDLNMLAMAAAVNGGKQFGALETTWADLIKEGHVVEMHLEPTYPGDSKRPESFVVEWTKDGEAQPPVKFRNIGTGELKNK